jgi:hypothetical protein
LGLFRKATARERILENVRFPAGRSFAVHGSDDDFCTFAGPESFIREALSDDAIGTEATPVVVAEVEREYGRGCMKGALAHHEAFMVE